MAFDLLALKNPTTGEIKMAPVGYSWTVLFFSCFPPLFRSDWKHFAIILVLNAFTFGFAGLVFSFIYNKMYIKDLIYTRGFKVTGCRSGNLQFIANKLGIELPMLG
jgi:hypothetical protein